MILTDVHVHTAFSADGESTLEETVAAARAKGLRVLGVSEHFDYDYLAAGVLAEGKPIPYTDAKAYFSRIRRLQAREAERGELRLLAGGEYGFAPLAQCFDLYEELNRTHRPDFVVNSVHTCDGYDCYFGEYFAGKSKRDAYLAYLDRVRESLDAPYRYDIVGHIGYVARNAPYPDPVLRYEEFADVIDDILKTVIVRRKILEVNTSSRTAGTPFLPGADILTRYFQLGGREISFASDAHRADALARGRETAVAALRTIGFTCLSVPDGEERFFVSLEE